MRMSGDLSGCSNWEGIATGVQWVRLRELPKIPERSGGPPPGDLGPEVDPRGGREKPDPAPRPAG